VVEHPDGRRALPRPVARAVDSVCGRFSSDASIICAAIDGRSVSCSKTFNAIFADRIGEFWLGATVEVTRLGFDAAIEIAAITHVRTSPP
jgi:hypothetical protein